jgi:hypothetical protein
MKLPNKFYTFFTKMNDFLKSALNGTAASALSTVACSPLDVLKTQFQVAGSKIGYRDLVRTVVKQQGYSGFYKGLVSTLSTRPVFYTIMYPLKEEFEKYQITGYSSADKVLSSAFAGWGGITATNPLWVLKTRMQTQILSQNGGLNDVALKQKLSYPKLISDIYQKEGFRSFYKGLGTSLLKGTEIGLIFPLYDCLKLQVNFSQHSFFNNMVAGASSKFVANLIMYPLDVIRTEQRNQIDSKIGIWKTGRELVKRHGSIRKGLYRGLGVYTGATGMQFATMVAMYDLSKINK